MRILLINSNKFKQPWPIIPYGLCSVAQMLEQSGFEVSFLDLCFSKNSGQEIAARVSEFKPDIIGISIRNIDNSCGYNTLFLLDEVKNEIIAPCKQIFKGPIVIGGPAVGISGPEMLEYFDLGYAIAGDGELAMQEFVTRVMRNESLEGLRGLIIRRRNGEVTGAPPFFVEDLNILPFPKFQNYVNLKQYSRFDSPVQIQTKRGCPLNCVYCTYNKIEGDYYRLREPKLIADEIERITLETGINHIEFTDSTFNLPLDHAKSVLREISKKKLSLRLRTMGLNPGAVDAELAGLMQAVGFQDVDLGAESGCAAMLKNLGKNFSRQDIINAAKLLHEKNIPIHWFLLLGAPGETAETIEETFTTISEAAAAWDLIDIVIGIRVYKGAPITKQLEAEKGQAKKENYFQPVNFSPEGIALTAIKRQVKEFALKRTNVFMDDEDEKTPMLVLKIGASLARLLRRPIWQGFIVIKLFEKYTGINMLKRIVFKLKEQ